MSHRFLDRELDRPGSRDRDDEDIYEDVECKAKKKTNIYEYISHWTPGRPAGRPAVFFSSALPVSEVSDSSGIASIPFRLILCKDRILLSY